MRLVELECPKCGARLSKINGTDLKCTYCGAVYLEKDLENGVKVEKQEFLGESNALNSPKTAGQNYTGTIAGFVFLLAIGMIVAGLLGMAGGMANKEPAQTVVVEKKDDTVGVIPMSGVPQPGEGFKAFAEKIFDKPYAVLGEEDFAKVTELYISGVREDHDVVCVVDGVTKEFYYWGTTGSIFGNFGLFTNLRVLETDGVLYDCYAENLASLEVLRCNSDMEDLAKCLPHPEKITVLSGVYINETGEELENFANLRTLEIEGCDEDIVDLSVLGSYKYLEEISLKCRKSVKNFNFLGELFNLKKIYLDASGLFSLEFARNLSNLEVLNVSGSSIESLAPIEGNVVLRELYVDDCDYLTDYSVIGTLTGLSHLSLTGDEREAAIEWANLTNLKSLYIEKCYSSDFAYEVCGLEKLSIEYNDLELEGLSALADLKELELTGTHDFLYFMKDLKNLEVLKIKSNNAMIFDGENIFNLPKLRELVLDDVVMALDFDKVSGDSVLEKLLLCDTSFNKPDLEDIEITEALEKIAALESITELAVRHEYSLENVDFALDFPNLTRLDVGNNLITDVSVLSKCPKLLWLKCDETVKDSAEGLGIEVVFE